MMTAGAMMTKLASTSQIIAAAARAFESTLLVHLVLAGSSGTAERGLWSVCQGIHHMASE